MGARGPGDGRRDGKAAGGGNTLAAVTLDLAAAETVYVFVDGYMGAEAGWTGPFELTVSRE